MNAATRAYILDHRDQSAADVAAALAADPYLVDNIQLNRLGPHLTVTRLSRRLRATEEALHAPELAAWSTLLEALEDLDEFRSDARNQYLGTSATAPFADVTGPTIDRTLSALVQLQAATENLEIGLTSEEAEAIRALGGGYRYDRLTTDEIEAAWAEIDAAAAVDALTARAAAGWNGVARWLAQVRAAGEPLPTDEEVVARYAVGLGS